MLSAMRRWPLFQKINSAYDQLPRRDQQAVRWLSLALLLFLVYFLIWQPLRDFRADAAARADVAQQRVAWLQANLEQARQLVQAGQIGGQGPDQGSGPAQKISDSRSMMSTVTASAQAAGLTLQRFEPSGDDKMRVWLDNTAFDNLARWLEKLTADYGIVVDQAAVDRANDAGRVNVRLTLSL